MKIYYVGSLVLLAALLVVTSVCASPQWQIALQVQSPGMASGGNCYIGAALSPPGFASVQSLPNPHVKMYEVRTDLGDGEHEELVTSDIRPIYDNCTYIWSNWYIYTNGNAGAVITVSWEPGTGDNALPAGTYILYDLNAGQQYDLSTAGSFDFTVGTSGVQKALRFVCTVGNGPELHKAIKVCTSQIDCQPVVEYEGYVYFGFNNFNGEDNSGKLWKVFPESDPPSIAQISVPSSGNIRGRLANYGDYVYGTTNMGRVMKCAKSGIGDNWKQNESANMVSTPAVLGDGTVYVGCGNRVKKLDSSGRTTGISPDLGGLTGSPSIPGTDMVWVNAGNKIVCLSSDLMMVRAVTEVDGTAGNPATKWNRSITAVTGGDKLLTFNPTSLALVGSYTAGGIITTSPFMDPQGRVAFAAADRKLYCVNSSTMTDVITPVQLPGTGIITGAPVVVGNSVAIAGGDDCSVFVVSRDDRSVKVANVNQGTRGCVTNAEGDKTYFTSTDGNLYILK